MTRDLTTCWRDPQTQETLLALRHSDRHLSVPLYTVTPAQAQVLAEALMDALKLIRELGPAPAPAPAPEPEPKTP